MRPPWSLETREARLFWSDQRITDLEVLRVRKDTDVFLAIDVEGLEGQSSGITEIGLAVWTPEGRSRDWNNVDLDDVVATYGSKAFCMRIRDRTRSSRYEEFRYGGVVTKAISEVEAEVLEILDNIKRDSPGKNITLVGFHMGAEWQAMGLFFPKIFQHLDSWTDLRSLIAGISRTSKCVSLRDTMLSLGFCQNYSIQHRSGNTDSSGMDAVRTLATMLLLLSRPTGQIQIERHSSDRVCWQNLPTPRSKYPHTAKINTLDGSPLPPTIQDPRQLLSYVTEHFGTPLAVATCPPTRPGSERLTAKTHGWVSLNSSDELERFLEEWDGRQVDGKALRVHCPQKRFHFPEEMPNGTHRSCVNVPRPNTTMDLRVTESLYGGIGALFEGDGQL